MKKSTGYILLFTCCICSVLCVTCISALFFISKRKDAEIANVQVSEIQEVPVDTEEVPIEDVEPEMGATIEDDGTGLLTVQSNEQTVFTEEDYVEDVVTSTATGNSWELTDGNIYVNCDLSSDIPAGVVDSIREQTYDNILLTVIKQCYQFDQPIRITSYSFSNSDQWAMINYIIDGSDAAVSFDLVDGKWTTCTELINMQGTDYMPIIFTHGKPSNALDIYRIVGENATWDTYITDYREGEDAIALRSADGRVEVVSL